MSSPLKIRLYGDSCLRKISSPIKEVSPAERMLIKSMIVTMHEYKGIGLAAPQVGINQRLFVADIGEGPIAVINPKIIRKFGSVEMEEGCLSIPEVNIKVKRPQRILVRYLDENNNEVEKIYEDLIARVILHETDHLDGKMITDYANSLEKGKYEKQLMILEAQYAGK